jgi:hypothetical protein
MHARLFGLHVAEQVVRKRDAERIDFPVILPEE